MADRFIAQHYFHDVLVHRVVKLSFSNKFFQSMASIRLDKHDIDAQLMQKRTFPCCMVTKLSCCIVFLRFIFVQNFIVFIATVGLSNENNCCQTEGIGKSVFFELIDLLMSLQIRPAFLYECFFRSFFFQNHAWKLRVRLIHECGLYMSVYGNHQSMKNFFSEKKNLGVRCNLNKLPVSDIKPLISNKK